MTTTILLILLPVVFFLGFYLQLVIKILVDILNYLQRLVVKQETIQQQETLNQRATPVEFVEPQSLAEIQAQEEMDRIERLNQ